MRKRSWLLIILFFMMLICVMQNVSAWWDTGWGYRKEITIDCDQVPDSLEYFPVLIYLSDPDLYGKLQDDAGDIAFIASNDTFQFNALSIGHRFVCFYNNLIES